MADTPRDLDDLHRLAPAVDTDAALDEFRRRRTHGSRRWPLLVAAVALVLVGGVGIAVIAADDDEPVVTGPADAPGTGGDVVFDVLAVTEAVDEMGTLRAATNSDDYAALLSRAGDINEPIADVDFERTVVVSITIPDDACPPELVEFSRDGATITPVFIETVTECNEPLIPKTYVVAIERGSLDTTFSVFLPADETFDIEERVLLVRLDGSPASTVVEDPVTPSVGEPTCADIERFADQLVDVAITYDYQASQSPAEVAESADVVFRGRLTGGFTDDTDSPDGFGRVGYEIEIDAIYKAPAGADLADPLTVFVDVGPVDPGDFEAAITPGTPVVVFGSWLDRPGNPLTAGIESVATGCPREPPIGFVGTQGEWAEVADLDDLAARLETLPVDG